MVKIVEGNIFDSNCRILVNPVNVRGVMGAGLAKQFKDRYPFMFQKYKWACNKGLLSVGKLWLLHEDDHDILLFPTKIHWAYPSTIDFLEQGLRKFAAKYKDYGMDSIAFPLLGTGCGALDKQEVLNLMKCYLEPLDDIEIEIYV